MELAHVRNPHSSGGFPQSHFVKFPCNFSVFSMDSQSYYIAPQCIISHHIPLSAVLHHTILCQIMYGIVEEQGIEAWVAKLEAMASSMRSLGRDLKNTYSSKNNQCLSLLINGLQLI